MVNNHYPMGIVSDESKYLWGACKAVLRKWVLILIFTLVCGAVAYEVTKVLIPPKYKASFDAYINNSTNAVENGTLTTADITASRNLTATYGTIITSQLGIEAAIKDAGLDMTYADVASAVSVKSLDNTEIIRVSVITGNPDLSLRLATALQNVEPSYVQSIVTNSSMIVITPANGTGTPCSPNYKKYTILGACLGLIFVLGVLFMGELMDNRIKSVDELNRYDIPVIGTIHDFSKIDKVYGYGYGYGYRQKGGR